MPTHRENPSKSNEKRSMKMTNEKKLDIQYNGLEICKLFFLINFWIHKTGFSFTGIAYFLIFRHTLSTGNKYCCVSILQLSHTVLMIYFCKPQTMLVPWLQVTRLTVLSDINKYLSMLEPHISTSFFSADMYLLQWRDCQFSAEFLYELKTF